ATLSTTTGENQSDAGSVTASSSEIVRHTPVGTQSTGTIKVKFADRKFGFIRTDAGEEYYFNAADLEAGFDFDALPERTQVKFEIRREASDEKAGAVKRVRPAGPAVSSA